MRPETISGQLFLTASAYCEGISLLSFHRQHCLNFLPDWQKHLLLTGKSRSGFLCHSIACSLPVEKVLPLVERRSDGSLDVGDRRV